MTPRQYAKNFFAKSCKVRNVYHNCTLNDIFIEMVDPFIRHSFKEKCTSSQQANLTDIIFKAQSILAIQKESTKVPHTGGQDGTAKESVHKVGTTRLPTF